MNETEALRPLFAIRIESAMRRPPGYTYKQLAAELGLDRDGRVIYRWVRGETKPSPRNAAGLARIFGGSAADYREGETIKPARPAPGSRYQVKELEERLRAVEQQLQTLQDHLGRQPPAEPEHRWHEPPKPAKKPA